MLTNDDYRLVLAALRDLAEPVEAAGYGRRALAVVRRVIPCEVAALNDVDPATGRFVFLTVPEAFPVPDDAREVLAEHASEHPLVAYVRRTGDGSARRISDVVSAEQFHASAHYRRLYQPVGVEYQMSVTLELLLPAVVAIAVSRGDTDFTDRERRLLDLLRPHLAAGWLHAQQVSRLTALLGSVTATDPAAGAGAVALTEPVRELTRGSLDTLARSFGRPAARTGLPPRVEGWLREQAEHHDAPPTPLLGRDAGRPVLVRLLRARPGQPGLLMLDTEPHLAPGALLGGRPRLSSRESEVLDLLLTGATNQGIAEQLHVAPGTVKKHLDNVYAKLGVRGRVQAATAAIELRLLSARSVRAGAGEGTSDSHVNTTMSRGGGREEPSR